MFTVGRSYELSFFTGSAKAPASLKATVIDNSLPLIKVRDGKGAELVINTSSAGFLSAKALKAQGEGWWRIARRRPSADASTPAGAARPDGTAELPTTTLSQELANPRPGENGKP